MQKQHKNMDSLPCPSFNSYSSDNLANIADKVSRDYSTGATPSLKNDDVDINFEFLTLHKAADEFYFDGHAAGPVFPIFNRDLLIEYEGRERREIRDSRTEDVMSLQFPVKKLLIDEEDQRRDPGSSSFSSEADELDAIPPGTYCVWTPSSSQASPSRCKKSKSTGSSSSKRWKLLDLLRRSNSDGKDSFVFLTPSSSSRTNSMDKKEEKRENSKERRSSGSFESNIKVAGKQKVKGSVVAGGENKVSAHEAFYVRNRALKEVDKRRSYLPYRQELVGFGATLRGLGRSFPPF
ncbi:DUF1645 family protein [Quillaja saponaria]|uniref:DUF1645 family protein n=1 Tax=Quillaja saponaria TaxID=32244 RepID=A0AAD7VGF4_QUISA|nr:DUF1645 family protein [Quillaja saponaria]